MVEINLVLCLARKIATLRRAQGLSQQDFANKIGISASYLGKIETGVSTAGVSLEILILIADHFHISVPTLLTMSSIEEDIAHIYFVTKGHRKRKRLLNKNNNPTHSNNSKANTTKRKRKTSTFNPYTHDGFSKDKKHFAVFEDFIDYCLKGKK